MIYLFQLVINTFCAFMTKESKVLGFFGFAWLAYLAGTMKSFLSFDTDAYESYFNHIEATLYTGRTFEPGYMWLNQIFVSFGVTQYQTFRLITFCIFFLLLFIVLLKFKANVNYFLIIYSVISFFGEVTQVRNFMMGTFILLALTFLAKKNKINTFIAIIFILVGSQFHVFGYYYLLLIPLTLISDCVINKVIKILPFISIIITMSFFAFGNIIFQILNKTSIGSRLSGYDTSSIRIDTLFLVLIVNICCSFIMLNLNKISQDSNILILTRCFCLMSFMTPIIILSYVGFERCLRFEIILVLIAVSILKNKKISFDLIEKNKWLQINIAQFVIFIICIFLIGHGLISFKYRAFGSSLGTYAPYMIHLIKTN